MPASRRRCPARRGRGRRGRRTRSSVAVERGPAGIERVHGVRPASAPGTTKAPTPSPARATTATSSTLVGREHAVLGAVEDPTALGALGRHGDVVEGPAAWVVGQGDGARAGAGGDGREEALALLGRARPRGPRARTGSSWRAGARARGRGPAPRPRPPSRRRTRPTPPSSSGTARAGQSSVDHGRPELRRAPRPSRRRRARRRGGIPCRGNERTEARSSSCSLVNSSSTALPSRAGRTLRPAGAAPCHGRQPRRVYLTPSSASGWCYLLAAPFSGKTVKGAPGGVAGLRRKPGPATTGVLAVHTLRCGHRPRSYRPLAYTLRCASSSTAEQRTLNPQVSGSNPEGRTSWALSWLVCSGR